MGVLSLWEGEEECDSLEDCPTVFGVLCEQVARGAKPAAMPCSYWVYDESDEKLQIYYDRLFSKMKEAAKKYGVKVEFPRFSHGGEEIIGFYIYKFDHIKRVFDFLHSYEASKTNRLDPVVRHWINGKLFGYSEEEIANYIKKHKKEAKSK
jgi:hypothetical protein